mmetsp:Transcript_38486/g.128688  ORF Transcript_38486/g.128688 Transcript_38486/m.128688 type:complete len:224 (+) Transcript_38486:834-1505(+)
MTTAAPTAATPICARSAAADPCSDRPRSSPPMLPHAKPAHSAPPTAPSPPPPSAPSESASAASSGACASRRSERRNAAREYAGVGVYGSGSAPLQRRVERAESRLVTRATPTHSAEHARGSAISQPPSRAGSATLPLTKQSWRAPLGARLAQRGAASQRRPTSSAASGSHSSRRLLPPPAASSGQNAVPPTFDGPSRRSKAPASAADCRAAPQPRDSISSAPV